MGITKTWKDVYDSALDLSHTGDTNWQTALNVTGRGEGHFRLTANGYSSAEIRVTLDGTVLFNGLIGWGTLEGAGGWAFLLEWEKTMLVEYRTNNAGTTAYLDAIYYNN